MFGLLIALIATFGTGAAIVIISWAIQVVIPNVVMLAVRVCLVAEGLITWIYAARFANHLVLDMLKPKGEAMITEVA